MLLGLLNTAMKEFFNSDHYWLRYQFFCINHLWHFWIGTPTLNPLNIHIRKYPNPCWIQWWKNFLNRTIIDKDIKVFVKIINDIIRCFYDVIGVKRVFCQIGNTFVQLSAKFHTYICNNDVSRRRTILGGFQSLQIDYAFPGPQPFACASMGSGQVNHGA